ncbi:MAG: flagellar motor protein MotA [Aliidongia sp.]
MLKPRTYLLRMALFLLVVGAIGVALAPALSHAFAANLALNGMIAAVLVIGILYIFRQVSMLTPEVRWIDSIRQHNRTILSGDLPRLLSPLANMLGDRHGRISLSPVSMRTLLDGIGARLDEQRETSRYLTGVLVFLGLLGTFYGLLETVRSVGGVVGGLSAGGADAAHAMDSLKQSLATPLAGMATAFSSSLFGLAGSLVLGFLDLQAGQAQNRFFNDLEEWLSGLTRLSASPGFDGEQSVPAYTQALLEQTADSLDNLQRIMARGEESRIEANHTYQQLSERLALMTAQMHTEQDVLVRIAETHAELKPALAKIGDLGRSGFGLDEATRNHIGNLDRLAGRIVEEMAMGRDKSVQEIRSEIRLLARTIAALAEAER